MKNKTANMFSLDFFRSLLSSRETTRFIIRLIGFLALFHVGTSFADPPVEASTTSSQDDWDVQLAKMLNIAVSLMYAVLSPMALLAGWFLTPDWTFGEIFGLREPLHNLWILVSNVVYVIFALALIVIAFMHVFGEWEKNYAIKSALPRLAVGLLMVPFTWFFVSASTSVANYLTASVMQLPSDILGSQLKQGVTFQMPDKCVLNFEKKVQTTDTSGATVSKFLDCGTGSHEVNLQSFLSANKSSYNLITLYSYSIFKFDKIQTINSCGLKTISKLSDMSLQTIISLVFFFAYALLLFALISALATRAIQLWFFAVISPIFGLFYFFSKKWGDGLNRLENEYSLSQLISLAMVPVYVAGALVFGFVFLQIIQNSEFKPDASQTASYFVKQNACTGENGGSCQMFTFGEGDQAFVLEARGEPFTMQNGCADGSGDTPGPAASVVNLASGAIGKIIINVLGLIVMWAAVFAALNTSKITQKAVEPIGEFGKSIANAAKTLPKNMPITVPGTDKQISMTGLQQAGRNLESAVNSGSNYTGGMEADVFKKILNTGAVGNILSELQEMNRKNPVNMNIPEQVGKRVKDMLDLAAQNGYGSDKIAANTNNIRTDLVKAMVEMGMKKEVAEAMLAGNTGIQVAGNIADYSRKNSNNVFGKVVTNEEAQEILDKNVKIPTTTTLKTDKKDEGSTDNQNSNNPSSSGVNWQTGVNPAWGEDKIKKIKDKYAEASKQEKFNPEQFFKDNGVPDFVQKLILPKPPTQP